MALTQTRGEIETARLLQDGAAAHRAGDLAAAERAYRKVLRRNPRDPDALHLLGVVVSQKGGNAEALGLIQKALSVRDKCMSARARSPRQPSVIVYKHERSRYLYSQLFIYIGYTALRDRSARVVH